MKKKKEAPISCMVGYIDRNGNFAMDWSHNVPKHRKKKVKKKKD